MCICTENTNKQLNKFKKEALIYGIVVHLRYTEVTQQAFAELNTLHDKRSEEIFKKMKS